ncbi:hypothetical protein ACIBCO_09920 [Streptomyces violascens]|uniref:hypothetical protein n=1 Tax=Streptomyces violascens TaxID=67381 RepID=UPI00378BACD8
MGSRDPVIVAVCRDLVLQVKPAVIFRYDVGASLAMPATPDNGSSQDETQGK